MGTVHEGSSLEAPTGAAKALPQHAPPAHPCLCLTMFTQILDCTIILGPAGGRALDHWNPRLSISRGWDKMLPRHEARGAVYCLPKWEAVNVTLACLLLAEGWQDAVRQQLICRAPGRGGVRGRQWRKTPHGRQVLQDGSRPLREVRNSKAILVEVPQAARGGGLSWAFWHLHGCQGPSTWSWALSLREWGTAGGI